MGRRPSELSPDESRDAAFAVDLRQLMSSAGLSVKETAAVSGVPTSTIYAAMSGQRLPSASVLSSLVKAWGGDPQVWERRRLATRAHVDMAEEPNRSMQGGAEIGTDVSLPGDRVRLASDLRRLFESLNISLRRYAAQRHLDPGSVSRYLNGGRVPPWHFVRDLLTAVEETGVSLSPEAVDHLKQLHRASLTETQGATHQASTAALTEPLESPTRDDLAVQKLRKAVQQARWLQHELTEQRNRQDQVLRELEVLRDRHQQLVRDLEEALSELKIKL